MIASNFVGLINKEPLKEYKELRSKTNLNIGCSKNLQKHFEIYQKNSAFKRNVSCQNLQNSCNEIYFEEGECR